VGGCSWDHRRSCSGPKPSSYDCANPFQSKVIPPVSDAPFAYKIGRIYESPMLVSVSGATLSFIESRKELEGGGSEGDLLQVSPRSSQSSEAEAL